MHQECDAIVQSIIHIRTRWELSQPDSIPQHTKIRPKDVPGTLLNIALLNLGSSDPSLRSVTSRGSRGGSRKGAVNPKQFKIFLCKCRLSCVIFNVVNDAMLKQLLR